MVVHDICYLFGKIGTQDPEAVLPTLLTRIERDGKVSKAALIVLADLGPSARKAAPRLVELCEADDWEVRALAIQALGQMGAKEAAPRIISLPQAGVAFFCCPSRQLDGQVASAPRRCSWRAMFRSARRAA